MGETIDFDDPKSADAVKARLDLAKGNRWVDFVKIKFLGLTLKETIAHFISLLVVIPYIVILFRGSVPIEVHDTLAKLIIGAYLAFLLK